MTIYAITGGGLKPIGNERISIHPNAFYGYGASSSPDTVFVLSVDEKWVTFIQHPYGDNTRREQLPIFKNLAHSGTRTALEGRFRHLMSGDYGEPTEEVCKMARHFQSVLNGEQGETWDRDDIRCVGIQFAYNGEGDGWSLFENWYPHSISGCFEKDGKTIYDSFDFSAREARELQAKMEAGDYPMPGFEFVAITPYR